MTCVLASLLAPSFEEFWGIFWYCLAICTNYLMTRRYRPLKRTVKHPKIYKNGIKSQEMLLNVLNVVWVSLFRRQI